MVLVILQRETAVRPIASLSAETQPRVRTIIAVDTADTAVAYISNIYYQLVTIDLHSTHHTYIFPAFLYANKLPHILLPLNTAACTDACRTHLHAGIF